MMSPGDAFLIGVAFGAFAIWFIFAVMEIQR